MKLNEKSYETPNLEVRVSVRMEKCQEFTKILMGEMNITMYNKIRKSYDLRLDKAWDWRVKPVCADLLFSLVIPGAGC